MVSAPSTRVGFAIITLNEEVQISQCLESLPPGFIALVVDSGSQDQTQAKATAHGAKVIHRSFTTYADQRNFAAKTLGTEWVFFVDADETLSPILRDWILSPAFAVTLDKYQAVRIHRRLYFMGRLLRFGKSQDAPIKAYKTELGSYTGEIHEKLVFQQPVSIACPRQGYLLHRSYRDLDDYFTKFNRYTHLMAKARGPEHNKIAVSLRPWWEFFSRYFLRLGMLDGFPGYSYALLSSLYAFVKYAKALEPRKHEKI